MNHPWEISPSASFTEEGDPKYKKKLATWPEFTLYEYFREGGPTSVELSTEVERAYRKAKRGIKDVKDSEWTKSVDQKIEMAETLENLGKLGQIPKGVLEDFPKEQLAGFAAATTSCLLSLIDHIGRPIAAAIAQPKAAQRERELEELGMALKSACLNIHRMYAPILKEAPDGRALLPINQMIIPIAIGKFREQGVRPTKSSIRKFLQGMGYTKEKNWQLKFDEAGLSSLPE